jgi:hypothetical protein
VVDFSFRNWLFHTETASEGAALNDFMVAIALIDDINRALALPPISRRKGHILWIGRSS